MFTGLVEEVGRIGRLEPRTAGMRLVVECSRVLSDAEPGASIAVNGVCLTAVQIAGGSFSADVAPETLARTNLGDLKPGSIVNLERPLAAGARLGGHIVQGHVDATGKLAGIEPLGDGNWWLTVRVPEEVERYVVFKGSIAIDGISLTVARIENSVLAVTIIPHTYENTALRSRKPGDRVNLEADILAKYVEKLLPGNRAEGLTEARLRELGY